MNEEDKSSFERFCFAVRSIQFLSCTKSWIPWRQVWEKEILNVKRSFNKKSFTARGSYCSGKKGTKPKWNQNVLPKTLKKLGWGLSLRLKKHWIFLTKSLTFLVQCPDGRFPDHQTFFYMENVGIVGFFPFILLDCYSHGQKYMKQCQEIK